MTKPEHAVLLEKLGLPQYSAERGQLLWRCSLDQAQIEPLASVLMANLECQLGSMEWGADRCYWPVSFEGTKLDLHFEALCEMLWLQCPEGEPMGAEVIAFFAGQVGAQYV